MIKKLISLF